MPNDNETGRAERPHMRRAQHEMPDGAADKVGVATHAGAMNGNADDTAPHATTSHGNAAGAASTAKRPQSRIAAIEGLRALAIAGVILYHLRPSLLPGGFLGVTVFFVLTGFLTTRSVVSALGRNGSIAYPRYLLRRLMRLLPPMLVVIGITAACTYAVSPSLLPKVQADALPSALFFSNWSYIFRKVSYFAATGLPSPLTHLWFLGVTMQFYLVWPLVLLALTRLCPKRTQAIACVAALALVSTVAMALMYDPDGDTARIYYGTDARAGELLVGAMLALAAPYVGKTLRQVSGRLGVRVLDIAALACLVVLCAGFFLVDGASSWLYRGGYLATALIAAITLACTMAPGSIVGRVLGSRPLAYVGSRSFSLYLVHYPLFILLNPATRTTAVAWWEQGLQVAAALVLAEVFYRLVERPLSGRRHGGEVKRSAGVLPYLLPALGALMVTALAFAPLDWATLAQERAQALRPELASKTKSKSDSDQTSQPDDTHGTPSTPTAQQSTGPSAEKVPANLDASGWSYDEASGTCNANALIIGDSVTEGAAGALQRMLPNSYVDGQVSRQLAAGPDIYTQDVAAGHDGGVVVVALGGNSLIRDTSQVQAMIDAVGGKPLYFVTIRSPYPLQDANNKILREFAKANDNVGIIDWKGASEGHSEYLVDDGVHLTEAGQEAFATLIRRALCGR